MSKSENLSLTFIAEFPSPHPLPVGERERVRGKISSIFGNNLIKGGEPGCAKSAVVSPVSADERSSMGFAKDAVSPMITARVRQSEFT